MTYFKNVVKRNGITVPFDEKKIENAIAKAFIAKETFPPSPAPSP